METTTESIKKAMELSNHLDDEGYPTDEYLDFLADHRNFNDVHEIGDLVYKWGKSKMGISYYLGFKYQLN